MFGGKKILLAVTGSIAAYKAAVLIRLLIKEGAEVKVIMTPAAHDFITPLTLATLSKNPVLTKFAKDDSGQWNNHVELGLWGDLMLIAPATTNTIAKLANGICDNLLAAVYFSVRCPVYIAPALDHDMYVHPATQNNLDKLRDYGNHIIDPVHGELASGLTGHGRMAEPESIMNTISEQIMATQRLHGKNILITAGPTHEAIDPVRFIGNNSSGKMGFALAEEFAKEGANVVLVAGPTNQKILNPSITVKPVISAEEMFNACEEVFQNTDITILSAAVADYKPRAAADQKIKKSDSLSVMLTKTHDIAELLGKKKNSEQIIVGFALETENEKENAIKKIIAKNFDLIVLNSLNDKGAGFEHDTNKISIIDRNEQTAVYDLKSKQDVAKDIVNAIIGLQKVHA